MVPGPRGVPKVVVQLAQSAVVEEVERVTSGHEHIVGVVSRVYATTEATGFANGSGRTDRLTRMRVDELEHDSSTTALGNDREPIVLEPRGSVRRTVALPPRGIRRGATFRTRDIEEARVAGDSGAGL